MIPFIPFSNQINMRTVYVLFFAALTATFFMASSSGAGSVQQQDRTGGPLANQFCGLCHATGAFNPSINVEVLDGETAVTTFQPGTTYTLRVTINAEEGAAGYGFQAVALTGSENLQAGSFTAGMGTQVVTLDGRDYVEHSQRSANNVFEVQWQAPTTGLDDIRFYAAGVAANGNGTSGGDGAAQLGEPVVLTNTRRIPELATRLTAFPNPAVDQLQLLVDLDENTDAQLRLYNGAGQLLRQETIGLVPGENRFPVSLAEMANGLYWLEINNGSAASRLPVMKQ